METREMEKMIREMEKQMRAAAAELQFERAAMLRDQVYELRALLAESSNLPPWKRQELLTGRGD
jgi:excinuclease ABC subunit B